MNLVIYVIIIVLYIVLLFWTWNNSKDYENSTQRVSFIIIGLIVLAIVTFILFNISKIGIEYPSDEIMKEIRKISILLFIPINGFLSLPHIASIKSEIGIGASDNEKMKKKIIILGIVFIIAIIIEVAYMKDFQTGIIEILNSK